MRPLAAAALLGAAGVSASEIIGYNGQELNYWAKNKAHAQNQLKQQVLAAIKPHEAATAAKAAAAAGKAAAGKADGKAKAGDVHMMNVQHSHEAMFVETPSLDVVRAISALALPPSESTEHAAVLGEIQLLAKKLVRLLTYLFDSYNGFTYRYRYIL